MQLPLFLQGFLEQGVYSKKITMRKYIIIITSIYEKNKECIKIGLYKGLQRKNITSNYIISNKHPAFVNFLKQFCVY